MSRFSGNAVKQGSTSARSSPFSAGSSLFSADLLSDANVFVHMLIEVINGRKLFWAARALVEFPIEISILAPLINLVVLLVCDVSY